MRQSYFHRLKRKYWKASEKLLSKHLDFETLHKFRLRTKRYRYTLELFRDIDPAIDSELQKLKPVQDLLGEINDCATALELIGATRVSIPDSRSTFMSAPRKKPLS